MGGPSMSGDVVANLDAIPGTPAGMAAAMNGGVPPTAIVYFTGDGTNLPAAARTQVRDAVAAFNALGGVGSIKVVGHASSRTANMPVERHLEVIFQKSQARANAVAQALIRAGVPADKVRIETRFTITPLYEQYREKNGQMVDNERADKIDRYQVSIEFMVEARDVRLVEPVYAILMSAKPSRSGSPIFRLEVSDDVRTEMFKLAVEDARKRAEQAAAAAGTRIGAVRLIDPTARGCETDELLAYARPANSDIVARPVPSPRMAMAPMSKIEELVVAGNRRAAEAGLRPEDLQLPVQPPLEQLTGKACVIYSLG